MDLPEPTPTPGTVERLISELNRLPGIGPKSAQRLAYHLLRASADDVRCLAEALIALKERTRLCSICCNVTDSDPCNICRSEQRNKEQICIVEQPQDILAIEHTGAYHGRYHVLHGAISPTEGVGPDNVRISHLMRRLDSDHASEVILATNTNFEGETTAMYLTRLIAPLNIMVTRLARGLPFGTELEYADDVTLTRALEGRQSF
jgi:recombination protein RecR